MAGRFTSVVEINNLKGDYYYKKPVYTERVIN